jgi:HlyD family secretion protein
VVWGYRGTVVTTASGQGVIVRSGGVLNVAARSGGVVTNIFVKSGDKVKARQVVAKVAQPVLEEKIKAMRAALAEALQQREEAWTLHQRSARLQNEALERQKANLNQQIHELNERSQVETSQIAAEQQLLEKGLVTRQQVEEAKQKVVGIDDQIAGLRAQIKQMEAQEFAAENQPKQDDVSLQHNIAGLQRDLAGLEEELKTATDVISPFAGQVLELKVYSGSAVNADQPVLSIQPAMQNLELLAYVPSTQAKDMKVGMPMQISPSNIKREEYGYIKGEILYVADYPATSAAMMRNFENEALVLALSRSGPITEIRASLYGDPSTFSKLKWSSSKGPQVSISSGTMCTVQIVTKEQRPISLLFPYIRDRLGMS